MLLNTGERMNPLGCISLKIADTLMMPSIDPKSKVTASTDSWLWLVAYLRACIGYDFDIKVGIL